MILDVPSIAMLFDAWPLDRVAGTETLSPTDLAAIGGILRRWPPARAFEIGTYYGDGTQFLLDHCDAKVVTIACLTGNNALPRDEVGKRITTQGRHTQLIGDSHKLKPNAFIKKHGRPDVILIDGDHSYDGVAADTELAFSIVASRGFIFWHDAGKSRKYPQVERFLRDAPFVVAREGSLACFRSLS